LGESVGECVRKHFKGWPYFKVEFFRIDLNCCSLKVWRYSYYGLSWKTIGYESEHFNCPQSLGNDVFALCQPINRAKSVEGAAATLV